tara:strand:+ start:264 stop:653 length:390 start_codon:yes stop_codon:yes gene_type:complete
MPKIEVSIGELIDKITILQIKEDYIDDDVKLKHIRKELEVLNNVLSDEKIDIPKELVDELMNINRELWDAEDVIRACEKDQDFSEAFVQCARLDAILNDKRFLAKNKINNHTESAIKEQKSYEGLYTAN